MVQLQALQASSHGSMASSSSTQPCSLRGLSEPGSPVLLLEPASMLRCSGLCPGHFLAGLAGMVKRPAEAAGFPFEEARSQTPSGFPSTGQRTGGRMVHVLKSCAQVVTPARHCWTRVPFFTKWINSLCMYDPGLILCVLQCIPVDMAETYE